MCFSIRIKLALRVEIENDTSNFRDSGTRVNQEKIKSCQCNSHIFEFLRVESEEFENFLVKGRVICTIFYH